MARKRGRSHRRRRAKPLGVIWRCPEDLWKEVARVLDELDPPVSVPETPSVTRESLKQPSDTDDATRRT